METPKRTTLQYHWRNYNINSFWEGYLSHPKPIYQGLTNQNMTSSLRCQFSWFITKTSLLITLKPYYYPTNIILNPICHLLVLLHHLVLQRHIILKVCLTKTIPKLGKDQNITLFFFFFGDVRWQPSTMDGISEKLIWDLSCEGRVGGFSLSGPIWITHWQLLDCN